MSFVQYGCRNMAAAQQAKLIVIEFTRGAHIQTINHLLVTEKNVLTIFEETH
jgi:hypothetical protein